MSKKVESSLGVMEEVTRLCNAPAAGAGYPVYHIIDTTGPHSCFIRTQIQISAFLLEKNNYFSDFFLAKAISADI